MQSRVARPGRMLEPELVDCHAKLSPALRGGRIQPRAGALGNVNNGCEPRRGDIILPHNDPILIIHGGAGTIAAGTEQAHIDGARNALRAGWNVLSRGGGALDAVEAAVVALEDDETFNAGRGSTLTRDGRVQTDALLMEGSTLRAGGVGCVQRIRNPIKAARLVLEKSPHVYFVADGAEEFAREHGMELIANDELISQAQYRQWEEFWAKRARSVDPEAALPDQHGTVGAIALDAHGNLAAATSTGGTFNKAPGRIGDSSLIGCGCYADNQSAAVSCTGWGEPFMKLVLGKWAADRVAQGGEPQLVAQEAIGYLSARLNGTGGLILLDRTGRFGISYNTPQMTWGVKSAEREEAGIIRV